MLRRLESVMPPAPGRPELGDNEAMQRVTRQVAFDPDGWTRDRAAKVAELFDGLAPEWHTRGTPERMGAVRDALERGGPFPDGVCLEIGCGVGLVTPMLQERFADVIATDLSFEMLRRAPAVAPLLLADGSCLPLADRSVGTVVLVNMFLFPREVERVLVPGGVVLWVNSIGPATPIYLAADDVARALAPSWTGVHAEAGWGTWASLRKPT